MLLTLGLFGAALLYGDGLITPAISVLSAVEGLSVATPVFESFIIPITLVILLVLFLVQRHGTGGIGIVFGPLMCLWFVTLAVLGVKEVVHNPTVLWALSPVHGVRFFLENGGHGFLVLGAVFLVVTGGEALYADMGHFGYKPIRAGVVRARAAGADAQLPGAGGAAAEGSGRRRATPSTCWPPTGRSTRWWRCRRSPR